MIKYESENAIVEVHFADITDSERQIRHKQLEQGLIKYYKKQDDEDHAAILLDEYVPRGQVQIKADKIDQIKNQMDEDHAEDAKAAQRVQLPDPVGFFHGNHLKSLQPAAFRGRLPK